MHYSLKIYAIFLFALFTINFSYSQEHNKGNLYLYWGWNQARYTDSDIRFFSNGYAFTLKKVAAKERQTPFDPKIYFGLNTLTIPQVNYRIGYFLNDHYDISIGVDHMKYVMNQNQTVPIHGYLKVSGSKFDGVYNGENIVLTEDFLTFEHTDGLNYVNFEVNRFDKIADFSKWHFKHISLNLTEGVSVGALLPRSNTKLLDNQRYDQFHLAGYGMAAKIGLNLTLYKHFYIQSDLKGGFINMPDIRTTEFTTDRAAQHFFFAQANILFGLKFHI